MTQIYPWQQSQWHSLYTAYQSHRLSHAYLLSGPEGLGKLHFAKTFAQLLLKKQSLETHPDFILLEPEEKSKTIKIDQIRAMSDKLSRTAYAGGYQIVVIDPADTLPAPAANALLKTVEEPSGRVIIFLIDHQRTSMLATLISRCQRIYFTVHDEKIMLSWLQQQFPSEKNLPVLLRLTQFSPLKVKQWIDEKYLLLRDQLLQYLLLSAQKKTTIMTSVAEFLKCDVSILFSVWIVLCVDIMRAQCCADKMLLTNQDQAEQIKTLAAHCRAVALQHFLSQLLETSALLSRGIPLNLQLCLEDQLITWEKVC